MLRDKTIDFSKLNNIFVHLILIITYLFFLRLLARPPAEGITFLRGADIRGIATNIQLIISVVIALSFQKRGFISAIILNAIGVIISLIYFTVSGTSQSLPGLLSYLTVILIVYLINRFRNKKDQVLKEIEQTKLVLETSEKKLYQQAYFDTLTNLPNRDMFISKLENEIEYASKLSKMLGIVLLDLDSFKVVNDTLGHLAGDDVLVEISRRLMEIQGDNFFSARTGGDEFYVLVNNADDVTYIEGVIEEIMETFRTPIAVKGNEFLISCSAGIAVYPFDGDDPVELIKNADMSMYEAKRQGKNKYYMCNDYIKKKILSRNQISNSLYKALENNEFFLHYQPLLKSQSKEVAGFEALIRWKSPEFGMVSPGEFIPISEQSGIIKQIGLWVFKTAVKTLKELSEKSEIDLTMSINFSLEQLKEPDITEKLIQIVEDLEVDPTKIIIEITESIAFNIESNVIEKLIEIKALGFKIAIDDFGKEYSSLNRICSFPVDLLKIDMDFVHRITDGNDKDRAVTKTIIQLSKNLGIKVLAEGVETKEQYEFLVKESCDYVQGYYFYKGVPIGEAEEILAKNDR